MPTNRVNRLEIATDTRRKAITRFFGIQRLLEIKDRLEKEPDIELVKPEPSEAASRQEVKKRAATLRILQQAEHDAVMRRQEDADIAERDRNRQLLGLKIKIAWNVAMGLVKIGIGLYGIILMSRVLTQPRADWRPILHVLIAGGIFYLLRWAFKWLAERRNRVELDSTASVLLDRLTELTRIVSWTAGAMFIVVALEVFRPQTLLAIWPFLAICFFVLMCIIYFFRDEFNLFPKDLQ